MQPDVLLMGHCLAAYLQSPTPVTLVTEFLSHCIVLLASAYTGHVVAGLNFLFHMILVMQDLYCGIVYDIGMFLDS